eukprot:6542026-Pyramimonas_sp.AAC.1
MEKVATRSCVGNVPPGPQRCPGTRARWSGSSAPSARPGTPGPRYPGRELASTAAEHPYPSLPCKAARPPESSRARLR